MAKNTNQYAVIGLGGFGRALTRTLYSEGADVLAVDRNAELVNAAVNFSTQAVCADATDEKVLERIGIRNFDVVAVCVGAVEASIFITIACKQMGVKHVVAKAISDNHKIALERIGADTVIFPEEAMGEKIGAQLVRPNMAEIIGLTPNFRMMEIKTPLKWQNKTLIQLDLRKAERVSIILIKRGEEIIMAPGGDCIPLAGDSLIIAGSYSDTERVSALATEKV